MLYLLYIVLNKTKNRGFTLIELLVVVIIIGILAAIAVPAYLNQASKARQSEGKTYLSTIVRAQQVYIIEKRRFACNGEIRFLGVAEATNNYRYNLECSTGIGLIAVTNQAIPLSTTRAYLGGVSVSGDPADALITICEGILPAVAGGATGNEVFDPLGFTTTAAPVCPAEYIPLK